MSTSVAAAAATEVATTATRLPRKFGTKQLFLPNHVIAFIRPLPKQPPNLATFVVPLQFNKLDLADYLKHAYNVDVLSVRSFINQKFPEKKEGHVGKWYRPRSEKMMIAELAKPFVWPDVPAVEDREGFDYKMFKRMEHEREMQMKLSVDPANIPLRTQLPLREERRGLRKQAKELLTKEVEWRSYKGSQGQRRREEGLEMVNEGQEKP